MSACNDILNQKMEIFMSIYNLRRNQKMYRIGQEEIDAVVRVLQYARDVDSNVLFKVNESLMESINLQEELCEKLKCEHAIFMTSGQAALTSAIVALGIGPGDEVIVPAYTYISTAMAVTMAGAIPILADVDESLTLCAKSVEEKITQRTKAIIPVHIKGLPCNMDALTAVAKKYNLYIVEDACQADGGSYKGKRLGTIGDIGAFSFNYFKIISCGEGGALVTNNDIFHQRALIYHDSAAVAYFGTQLEGFETELFCGNEYRSNELCAALLRAQLKRLDDILVDCRKNKKYIMDAVKDMCAFVPSNDIEGDCGTVVAFQFTDEATANRFATTEGVNGSQPVYTGKHVFKNWTSIVEKRGAVNPKFDPFKMDANKDIEPDYSEASYAKTLDILARSVYVNVNPDATMEELDKQIECIKNGLKNAYGK